MAEPVFLGDGPTPRRGDALWAIEQKILGAIVGGAGGGGAGAGFSGTGSPEGVVTAAPGAVYTDVSTGGFWNKVTGTGNTGWNQLVV
jgi:hypothetical protein